MGSFTELEVWKRSLLLRNSITDLVKSFPPEEKYRLKDQIVRLSGSIGNNIAERHSRFHYLDASKFLINARESAGETIDHLIVAFDNNYIGNLTVEKLKQGCEGYISYLRKQAHDWYLILKEKKTNL